MTFNISEQSFAVLFRRLDNAMRIELPIDPMGIAHMVRYTMFPFLYPRKSSMSEYTNGYAPSEFMLTVDSCMELNLDFSMEVQCSRNCIGLEGLLTQQSIVRCL